MNDQKKTALLIDAENISAKYADLIFSELEAYSFPAYKRVYGSLDSIKLWHGRVLKYAMTPVMQFNYTKSKNASESALIIDAMDILYSNNVDGFCLVTSDSNFTKLVIRLREAGMFVMGMGEKDTPLSLVRACEEFKYLDILYSYSSYPENKHESILKALEQEQKPVLDIDTLKKYIHKVFSTVFREKNWVRLDELGRVLPRNIPGFDARLYGFKTLKEFVLTFEDLFDVIEGRDDDFMPVFHVRYKQF